MPWVLLSKSAELWACALTKANRWYDEVGATMMVGQHANHHAMPQPCRVLSYWACSMTGLAVDTPPPTTARTFSFKLRSVVMDHTASTRELLRDVRARNKAPQSLRVHAMTASAASAGAGAGTAAVGAGSPTAPQRASTAATTDAGHGGWEPPHAVNSPRRDDEHGAAQRPPRAPAATHAAARSGHADRGAGSPTQAAAAVAAQQRAAADALKEQAARRRSTTKPSDAYVVAHNARRRSFAEMVDDAAGDGGLDDEADASFLAFQEFCGLDFDGDEGFTSTSFTAAPLREPRNPTTTHLTPGTPTPSRRRSRTRGSGYLVGKPGTTSHRETAKFSRRRSGAGGRGSSGSGRTAAGRHRFRK